MKAAEDDSLGQAGCEVLIEHSGSRVVIQRGVRKQYESLDVRAQGRLHAIMKRWCDDPSQLTSEMFNGNEGRTARHNIMLQAFKNNSAKVRLYGFSFPEQGAFIIVDADMAKKQDKADPKILKRAKARVDTFLDNYRKKGI